MSLTYDKIREKLDNLIDYREIAENLENDLNAVAHELLKDDPQNSIDFKVFFDVGEFDAATKAPSPGEGPGFHTTPVLLSLIDGSFGSNTGPQAVQAYFRIEAFGFKKDVDNLRDIFSAYSYLNRGELLPEYTEGVGIATSVMDFPIVSEIEQYRGFERLSVFVSWVLTFFYDGQLSNEVKYTLNGNPINIEGFNIKRDREISATHRNNEDETRTINTSQILGFTGVTVFDGTEATVDLLKQIKDENSDMKKVNTLKVEYPSINEVDEYSVVLVEGDVAINRGDYLILTFAFALN